jgi:hypothetical protein
MTADDFRRLALSQAGASEQSHMGHPDFRAGGRIFASLGYPDDSWAMVVLTPEEQRIYMTQAPEVFRPAAGAWGRSGSTQVVLALADEDLAGAVLRSAAMAAAAKKPARTRR